MKVPLNALDLVDDLDLMEDDPKETKRMRQLKEKKNKIKKQAFTNKDQDREE